MHDQLAPVNAGAVPASVTTAFGTVLGPSFLTTILVRHRSAGNRRWIEKALGDPQVRHRHLGDDGVGHVDACLRRLPRAAHEVERPARPIAAQMRIRSRRNRVHARPKADRDRRSGSNGAERHACHGIGTGSRKIVDKEAVRHERGPGGRRVQEHDVVGAGRACRVVDDHRVGEHVADDRRCAIDGLDVTAAEPRRPDIDLQGERRDVIVVALRRALCECRRLIVAEPGGHVHVRDVPALPRAGCRRVGRVIAIAERARRVEKAVIADNLSREEVGQRVARSLNAVSVPQGPRRSEQHLVSGKAGIALQGAHREPPRQRSGRRRAEPGYSRRIAT